MKPSLGEVKDFLQDKFLLSIFLVGASGYLIIFLENFSDPFDILLRLAGISFTVGSVLFLVWSEIRRNLENSSRTLDASLDFLKSGVYFIILAPATRMVKSDPLSRAFGRSVPSFISELGIIFVGIVFVISAVLSFLYFGMGLEKLFEEIERVKKWNE
ncbi:hypothetical protein [Candidatus Nanohalococcus occultus]|uniref:DUF1616 domain-containing protein n=1 Tax=Candidatus Nanohalococcus occultus TaxID=2978047 RepID=A0ABY8CGK2_9ARCH|nr:hypothetical protein SVXNc_0026 [Candidatus Nanohaloarchaeota archaeon SVXNc]